MDSALLTQVLEVLVTVLGGVLVRYGVPFITSHVNEHKFQRALSIAERAYHKAEQIGAQHNYHGSDKMDLAVELAQGLGNRFGVKLSADEWAGVLESVVHEAGQVVTALEAPSGTQG